jgi:dephospho-CoA kinase
MKVLGLTGSIAMGKTTAARMLRRLGVPVHDADAAVHRALGKGGAAVPEIARLWPNAVTDGAVDRAALGAEVFEDPQALDRLEAIMHPLARRSSEAFLARHRRLRTPLVVLDIPLLFETGAEARCDAVAVVSAPDWLQAQRVLARPGMTPERLEAIRARQMPDREKRRRARYVVETGLGKRYSLMKLAEIVRSMTAKAEG